MRRLIFPRVVQESPDHEKPRSRFLADAFVVVRPGPIAGGGAEPAEYSLVDRGRFRATPGMLWHEGSLHTEPGRARASRRPLYALLHHRAGLFPESVRLHDRDVSNNH